MTNESYKTQIQLDILERKMAEVWPPQEQDDSSDDTSGNLFAVTLAQTGGANGSQTTAATWTYTVTAVNGQQLATAAGPEVARPTGTMTAASKGIGYKDQDGAFHLLIAFEIPGTDGACSA